MIRFPGLPGRSGRLSAGGYQSPRTGLAPFQGKCGARLGQAGLLECPLVQPVTAAVVPPLLQTEDRYLLPQFRTLGTGK